MSAAPTDCRVPDPSDKLDAKADGQFQAVNRRAGYGDDRLSRTIATARKGWTLAAGEGLVLVQEIDRLRKEFDIATSMLGGKSRIINGLQDEMDHARALLIDLKRWRDEAERSRPIVQAAQAYLDSGGSYTTWLALRQLIPLSETSPYATEP